MKSKKPTVTVAVCAYNEEQNITQFLASVLMQREVGFVIKTIVVISDGSTDSTVSRVKSIKDKRIEVVAHKKREGKSSRLNELYKKLRTDFLVQSDADIVFSDKSVVENMVRPLIQNPDVMMCGGNPIPLPGLTLVEKAVNITTNVYRPFRHLVRGGNNVFSADGRLLSYRNTFVKSIKIPSTMIANDAFTYFCCISAGHKYRYVQKAIVFFRSPQTIRDQWRQNTRFLAAPIRLRRYFGNQTVNSAYHIPSAIYWKSLLSQFTKYPLLFLVAFFINSYTHWNSRRVEKHLNAKWAIAKTTKKGVHI